MPAKLKIDVANEQSALEIDVRRLKRAVKGVLAGEGIVSATISLAIVDDTTIHRLNRQFLNHDYPTDVLSFVLERDEESLEGEVIVSAETAQHQAGSFGWSAESELLLYVVHGTLHLVGYDDHSDADRATMRQLERRYLAELGIEPPET